MRQPDDIEYSDIPLATLDATNIVAVQIRQLRQMLLGEPALNAQIADAPAK